MHRGIPLCKLYLNAPDNWDFTTLPFYQCLCSLIQLCCNFYVNGHYPITHWGEVRPERNLVPPQQENSHPRLEFMEQCKVAKWEMTVSFEGQYLSGQSTTLLWKLLIIKPSSGFVSKRKCVLVNQLLFSNCTLYQWAVLLFIRGVALLCNCLFASVSRPWKSLRTRALD